MSTQSPWRWVVLALVVVAAGYFGGVSSVIAVLSGAVGGYLASANQQEPEPRTDGTPEPRTQSPRLP